MVDMFHLTLLAVESYVPPETQVVFCGSGEVSVIFFASPLPVLAYGIVYITVSPDAAVDLLADMVSFKLGSEAVAAVPFMYITISSEYDGIPETVLPLTFKSVKAYVAGLYAFAVYVYPEARFMFILPLPLPLMYVIYSLPGLAIVYALPPGVLVTRELLGAISQ